MYISYNHYLTGYLLTDGWVWNQPAQRLKARHCLDKPHWSYPSLKKTLVKNRHLYVHIWWYMSVLLQGQLTRWYLVFRLCSYCSGAFVYCKRKILYHCANKILNKSVRHNYMLYAVWATEVWRNLCNSNEMWWWKGMARFPSTLQARISFQTIPMWSD